jgi:serine/threonine-protein kinase
MAYELFLEQLPFEAETSAEIMAMHLRCTPPPPSELWPDMPAALEDLLLAMLAKDPDARPSMLTVAHTLEQVRGELEARKHQAGFNDGPPARSSTRIATVLPFERRSNRIAAVGAGLAPTERASASRGFAAARSRAGGVAEVIDWPARTPRRLPAVLGAIAITASAALFILSRSSEPAAASTVQPPPAQIEANAAVVDEPVEPIAAIEPPTVTPPPAEVAPASVDAPTPPRPVKRSKTARRVQVKPHLEAAIDPNGVLDPY